jgi:TMEM175 potassium channel family protein
MGPFQTKETGKEGTGKVFCKNRIETLTDGVFAIAMTLLVTGLDIPKLNGIVTSGTVDTILVNLFPDFIHYIIAFVLLAIFWWASHLRSHYLQSIDSKMGFLTIATLLFVGLIPFSTNLAGDFPLNTHAVIIFEFNLFVIGLLSVLQWNQIIYNATCLDPNADIRTLISNREEAYIFPVLSSLAILLAIISVPWGIFIYCVAPVYLVLMWLKETRLHSIKQKPVHKNV